MLSIIPCGEVLSLLLQPIDNRICVLLDRRSKDNEIEPLADFSKEVVAIWPFMDVVENGMLRTKSETVVRCGMGKFDFDHVTAGHAATLSHGMYEGLVKINYKSLLGESVGIMTRMNG